MANVIPKRIYSMNYSVFLKELRLLGIHGPTTKAGCKKIHIALLVVQPVLFNFICASCLVEVLKNEHESHEKSLLRR